MPAAPRLPVPPLLPFLALAEGGFGHFSVAGGDIFGICGEKGSGRGLGLPPNRGPAGRPGPGGSARSCGPGRGFRCDRTADGAPQPGAASSPAPPLVPGRGAPGARPLPGDGSGLAPGSRCPLSAPESFAGAAAAVRLEGEAAAVSTETVGKRRSRGPLPAPGQPLPPAPLRGPRRNTGEGRKEQG